jgi:hypothetical protein
VAKTPLPWRLEALGRRIVNGNSDPQLAALAWLVFGALVACVAAVVALVRSGRPVPPLGGVSLTGSGPDLEAGRPPYDVASSTRARGVSGASRRIYGSAHPPARGR